MSGTLILVRHGQSTGNLNDIFTGWQDADLTELGMEEARAAGRQLKQQGIVPEFFYTSALQRARRTLDLMLEAMDIADVTISRHRGLNERDYGDLTGLSKADARARWGDAQVQVWRRSYDVSPPGGESLKATAARTLPYYRARIEPNLAPGKTALVVAHGTSLRALVMAIEQLTPDEIVTRELATGQPMIYRIDSDGRATLTV